MKVLHIVGDSKFGGASVPILRLAQFTQSLGWQTEVLTTEEIFTEMLNKKGIKTVNLDVIWREIRPIKDLKGLSRLSHFLKTSDYTIVHTHTSKAGFIGRLAAKLAGIPVIVHTVQGFAFHEASSPLALTIYATLERLAAQWCDRLVLVTKFHRQWALQLGIGNPQKNQVIPNWIYPERIQINDSFSGEDYRRSLGIKPNEWVLLVTGRLAKQKGHEYLLKAIPLVTKNINKPLRLLIAGVGNLEESLKQLTQELKIENEVLFLGFCSEVNHLLAISDVVILPSLWEGLSISLLEAMAMGKAIITTTIGSNLEVLEDQKNALLVPAKDSSALTQAILRLAQDPNLCQTLATHAKLTYNNHFSESVLLNHYQELYLQILQKKNLCT